MGTTDLIDLIVRNDADDRGSDPTPFDRTFDRAMDLATDHPESVVRLAVAVMDRSPRGGTFFDAALSFLREDDWPEAVRCALDALGRDAENEAAKSVIAYASMQRLQSLHPHLRKIWELAPNADAYYANWPWRESGMVDVPALRTVLHDHKQELESRRKAWQCLFETRNLTILDYLVTRARDLERDLHLSQTPGLKFDNWLLEVGHELREGSTLRPLYVDRPLHLAFPTGFLLDEHRPSWLSRTTHPTWRLPAREVEPASEAVVGGECESPCSVCGNRLHRLLVLEPVPSGLGIGARARLEFATCLSCLGFAEPALYYEHDGQGRPRQVGYSGSPREPEFRAGPLRPTRVRLVDAGSRWRWQDWALSNGRENLNRVGGHPCWIQGADYLKCPRCRQTMQFVFQLDSDLPTAEGGEWLWGSGGISYCLWCDACGISGLSFQCT